MFTPTGCRDIEIRKFEVVAKLNSFIKNHNIETKNKVLQSLQSLFILEMNKWYLIICLYSLLNDTIFCFILKIFL